MKLADVEVGMQPPLFLIAGNCVIGVERMALDAVGNITGRGIPFINQTSDILFRGLGMEKKAGFLKKHFS